MTAHIVVDLGYGDSGKGLTVDYLARTHRPLGVVRYGGGAQCAHNVITPDGRHHTFNQFGAGTFAGVPTYLSKHVLVNPHLLLAEGVELAEKGVADPFGMIAVQSGALITTPFHVAANRIREARRGEHAHGSCGLGIGETRYAAEAGYWLTAYDTTLPYVAESKLANLREFLLDDLRSFGPADTGAAYEALIDPTMIDRCLNVYEEFNRRVFTFDRLYFNADDDWIFEGHQGVLLDEYHGWHPHTTWSKTTTVNAENLLLEADFKGDTHTWGVMRTYMTRHGAGPLSTETRELSIPEIHNDSDGPQGDFRIGWTDLAALRYAKRAITADGGDIDSLVITHMDRLQEWAVTWKMAYSFPTGFPIFLPRHGISKDDWEEDRASALQHLSGSTAFYKGFHNITPEDFCAVVSGHMSRAVELVSYGPTANDVRTRIAV